MKWVLIAPEIYFLLIALVFFVLTMIHRQNARRDYKLALFLALAGVVVGLTSIRLEGSFYEVYRVDLFSQVFKVLLTMGFFLVVCICSELRGISERRHPEFYLLLALCTLAMMLLVSSVELLTVYLSLELTSYSLYILVALRKDYGMETGMKYFFIGAATSAVMLMGLASLYGATGTTQLSELVRMLPDRMNSPMVLIGLIFTLCGFFFKLALFPFHVWAPTVYQGAANQVTAYIATATKVAAVAILMRFVTLGAGEKVYLTHFLVALAIASMTLGNLAAIVQKDLKRLLAYSAIAHAGYVTVGILAMSESGYAGAIFYALAYLTMNFVCFLVLVKVASDGENLEIVGLAGLHRRSPLLAAAMMVGVFSLGGIPPTIGFTGKFLVFLAAVQKGHFYLVLIGMINVVISLYYYALVVKAAYLIEPETDRPAIHLSAPVKLLTVAMLIIIVVGGIYPGQLYSVALAAAKILM
jgi:NADH-quinone oxidoreductase subunit N